MSFSLEDKAVICKFSESEQVRDRVEFVDDTGTCYIELINGKHITLTAAQVRAAKISRGGTDIWTIEVQT